MTEQQLARSLVQAGLLTPQQVQAAVQRRSTGITFAQALVDMGLVGTMDILQFDPDAFSSAAASVGTPVAVGTNGHATAMPQAMPQQMAPVAYAGASAETSVGLGQDGALELDDSGVKIEGENNRVDDPVMGTIVTYCNELLKIAVQMRASDMHLEPRAGGLLPRYRVDGHLHAGGMIPPELQPSIVSRLKVLANLDITENRLPQDGRFRATIGGRVYDFRVSTLPSMHGEKVVMRLLDRTSLVTDLTRLGFTPDARTTFEEMLKRSYGMILVTGPTGSGKTTTLYAALSVTRDETKNIVTVEDPVEYELDGITQTKVHSEIGLTFATQLRAILRQDPDVILVGEIRDTETAEVAIRAALTGHLVLATLHTNSAVAAVTRLQDMGIPAYLIASSLSGVLAQRLVRMICRHCRQPVPFDDPDYQSNIARLKLPPNTQLYRGAGCPECNGTGMRGRLAITELLNVDGELRRHIMEKSDADTLRKIAVQHGMKTLWQDSLDKLQRGLTTADEVVRVLLGAEDTDTDEVDKL
ncbi:MAG: type II/IV secretion system protein [Abitibacteriaceae bacterium]|nr:type II/IV secretion system protein [Abditibacteriaceae bacterium]MBV9864024.1 type II/IV secretion system protein [Abditibacteriaceae bacterium]